MNLPIPNNNTIHSVVFKKYFLTLNKRAMAAADLTAQCGGC